MIATAPEAWHRREPERLDWELDQFERHGLAAQVSYDREGRLVVATEVRFRGEPLALTATYSHGHPYFSPTIAADRLVLDRHQHPLGNNFCLLEDADDDWRPSYSAAQLIGKSLRRLLSDVEKGKAAVFAGEADMPEPVSAQFPYHRELVLLVGEPFLVRQLEARGGTMSVILGPGRGRVLAQASGIGSLDQGLVASLGCARAPTQPGRWVALDAAPRPEHLGGGVLAALDAAEGRPLARLARRLKEKKGLPRATLLVDVTFTEQGPTREQERRAWLLAEVVQRRGYKALVERLFPAQALSAAERERRIPELSGLSAVHVVVVGAGSLGAPTALDLAKAGVGRLQLFDPDHYDVNNAVRHVLPVARAGELKAEAVAGLCRDMNPFVDVRGHPLAVGHSAEANALLEEALGSAGVVIDTTGAQAVGRFLDPRARAAGATLIVAGLTAGSYGADAFIVAPGGARLDCFPRAQADGRIPRPPEGERSAVTPIGCSHPAFAGAGFEATELAAVVARRALQATGATSYPVTDSSWIVLDFRGGPHFRQGRLEQGPDCETDR